MDENRQEKQTPEGTINTAAPETPIMPTTPEMSVTPIVSETSGMPETPAVSETPVAAPEAATATQVPEVGTTAVQEKTSVSGVSEQPEGVKQIETPDGEKPKKKPFAAFNALKKWQQWAIVLGVLAVIVAVILVVALLPGSGTKKPAYSGPVVEGSTENNGGTGNDAGDEAEDGSQGEVSVIREVSFNNATVQKLWSLIQGVARLDVLERNRNFYTSRTVQAGEIPEQFAIDYAVSLLTPEECKISDNFGTLSERYPEIATGLGGNEGTKLEMMQTMRGMGCVDGKNVIQQVMDLFEMTVDFEERPLAHNNGRTMYYSPDYDEFYVANTTSGEVTSGVEHEFDKAERLNEFMYIYETPYYTVYDEIGKIYRICSVKISDCVAAESAITLTLDEYQDEEIRKSVLMSNRADIPQYKWNFRRNKAGNYIFVALREVEE